MLDFLVLPNIRYILVSVAVVVYISIELYAIFVKKMAYVGKSKLSVWEYFILLSLIAMLALPRFYLPLTPARFIIGLLLIIVGQTIIRLARWRLGSHSTHPEIPTDGQYMKDGVYILRHPMYVGFAFWFFGTALWASSWLAILWVLFGFINFAEKMIREERLRITYEHNK